MKSKLLLFAVAVLCASSLCAQAPAVAPPVAPAPVPAAPAAGFTPSFDLDVSADYNSAASQKVSGGVGLAYWFMPNVGARITAALPSSGSSGAQFSGDVLLRVPVGDGTFTTYAFGGGGVATQGGAPAVAHGGAGVEYKLNPNVSLFTEGLKDIANSAVANQPINVAAGLRVHL